MKNIDNEVRANRGGTFDHDAEDCCAFHRCWSYTGYRSDSLGFRVLRRKKP